MAIIQEVLVKVRGQQNLNKLDKNLKKVGKTSSLVTKSFGALAGVLALGAVIRGLNSAIKSSTEYGKALANINAIANLTQGQLKAVANQIDNITSAHGQKSADVLKAYYDTLSAGFNDATQANILIEASARSAVAGNTTIAKATDLLTSTLNAYGLAVEDVTRVQDILQQTVVQGKTTIDELSSSIGRVLPLAKSMGVELESATGALAALTLAGLSTEESATVLTSVFSGLLKPTKDLEAVFDLLGVANGKQLVQQRGLAGAIEAVTNVSKANGIELAKLFANKRALIGVNVFLNDGFETLKRTIDGNVNSVDAAAEAYDRVASTEAFKLQQSLSSLEIATKNFGNTIAPAKRLLIDLATAFVKAATAGNGFFDLIDGRINEVLREELPDAIDAEIKNLKRLTNAINNTNQLRGYGGTDEDIAKARAANKEKISQLEYISDLIDDILNGQQKTVGELKTVLKIVRQRAQLDGKISESEQNLINFIEKQLGFAEELVEAKITQTQEDYKQAESAKKAKEAAEEQYKAERDRIEAKRVAVKLAKEEAKTTETLAKGIIRGARLTGQITADEERRYNLAKEVIKLQKLGVDITYEQAEAYYQSELAAKGIKDSIEDTRDAQIEAKILTGELTEEEARLERIKIRVLELQEKGINITYEQVVAQEAVNTKVKNLEKATEKLKDAFKEIGRTIGTEVVSILKDGVSASEGLRNILLKVAEKALINAIELVVQKGLEYALEKLITGEKKKQKDLALNINGTLNKGIDILNKSSGVFNKIGNQLPTLDYGGLLSKGSAIFDFARGIFGFNSGGVVPNTPGSTPGRDSVPALLTPGETVIPAGQSAGGSTYNFTFDITGDVSEITRNEILGSIDEITNLVNSKNLQQGT